MVIILPYDVAKCLYFNHAVPTMVSIEAECYWSSNKNMYLSSHSKISQLPTDCLI